MPFAIYSGENLIFKFALLSMPDGANFLGAWDSGTNYVINDVVIDAEIAYIATADNLNQEPPNITYWDALSGTPADDILNFKLELVTGGNAKVTYYYDGETLPPNMTLVDGMIQFELLASDTLQLVGTFEVRISVTVADAEFFDSAGQTDIVCLADVLTVSKC
jgi:hypothetical protein